MRHRSPARLAPAAWLLAVLGAVAFDRWVPEARATSFIRQYSNDDGLLQGTIKDIEHDGDGYLWLATDDGLVQFDGYEFRTHRSGHDQAIRLPDNNVHALLHEKGTSRLWIGTEKGLIVYDVIGGTRRLPVPSAEDIVQGPVGIIWVATGQGGLVKVDSGTLEIDEVGKFDEDFLDSGDQELSILWDEQRQRLWIASPRRGLARYDPATNTVDYFTDSASSAIPLKSDRVFTIYEDRSGRLWIGYRDAGFSILETHASSIVHSDAIKRLDSLSRHSIYAFLEDVEGTMWIGSYSDGGVVELRPDGTTRTHKIALINESVQTLHQDFSGQIWIGTASGLNVINPWRQRFGHVPGPDGDGLNERIVSAVYEDDSGVLWIGTWGGGLNRFYDDTWSLQNYRRDSTEAGSLSNDTVISIAGAPDGHLWVGTRHGLNLFDPQTGRAKRYFATDHPTSLASNFVADLRTDRSGRLWARTDKAVQLFDPAIDGFVTKWPELGEDARIFFDSHDRLWICVAGGVVYLIEASRVYEDQFSPAPVRLPVSEKIEPLLEDSGRNIWFSTGQALGRLTPDLRELRLYTEADGLPNDMVYGALEDHEGNIWVSTNLGLARLNPTTDDFETFMKKDGLQGNEFNGESFLKRKNGMLVFGGINGLNLFEPADIVANSIPPLVRVASMTLFKRDGESPEKLARFEDPVRISPDRYGFEISFVALHYGDPSRHRYQYRLEGLDENWIEANAAQRTARYTTLSPGTYVFRVRGSSSDGVWSEPRSGLRIVVLPPWWRTFWAYLAYALLAATLVYTITRWRTLALRRHAMELESLVRERTADVERQKSIIERQMEELKSLDQAKERFFENISHEFRTPLTVIIGPLKRLLETTDDPAARETLKMAQRNAARLLGLINELLQLSRLESGVLRLHRRTYPLARHLRLIVAEIAPAAREQGVKLALELDDELRLSYDAEALEKIVVNLLSNALKFTPAGGRITMRTDADAAGSTVIEVSDNGEGIPPEDLPHIFQRFRRGPSSARRPEGSGIGLSLVKELVELHGATIGVESAVGAGTCFTITFPPREVDEEPAELEALDELGPVKRERMIRDRSAVSERPSRPAAGAFEHTLLIVEDDPDMRAYLAELLGGEHRLLMAENGRIGLEAAIEEIPDLVISDVMMPEMDGLELSRAIRAHEDLSHIPLILLTAKGGKDSRLDGLREGVDQYLVKPFDEDELKLIIRNLIAVRDIMAHRFGAGELTGDRSGLPASERPFFDKLNRVLEENFSNPDFKAADIPPAMGKSPRSLQRKLNDVIGLTPSQYLLYFRLEKAAGMLLAGSAVTDACSRSGFTSDAHFSRCFKARFGVPPSQYTGKKKR